jgi:hypothetical protein
MSRTAGWTETLRLRSAETVTSVYCLEPNEVISITSSATNPIKLAILDWRRYLRWERESTISLDWHVVTTRRIVSGALSATDPPYAIVFVVSNPSHQTADVHLEVDPVATTVSNRFCGAGE